MTPIEIIAEALDDQDPWTQAKLDLVFLKEARMEQARAVIRALEDAGPRIIEQEPGEFWLDQHSTSGTPRVLWKAIHEAVYKGATVWSEIGQDQ